MNGHGYVEQLFRSFTGLIICVEAGRFKGAVLLHGRLLASDP